MILWASKSNKSNRKLQIELTPIENW